MKKGISTSKVQRMRNLATGNINAKSNIQSGYGKKSNRHVEGDVWEERGKMWIIKDGIKQSITKLDSARKEARLPPHCPKCDARMKASQHKFMYVRFGHCLFCQTKEESNLRKDGKYEDWKDKKISNNFDTWLEKSKIDFEDWLKGRNAKQQITEAGMIEDWSGGKTDEELRNDFNSFIEKEKERLTTILKQGEQK